MPIPLIIKLLILLVGLLNPVWLLALLPLFLRWKVGRTPEVAQVVGVGLAALAVASRVMGLLTGGPMTVPVLLWIAGNGLYAWGYLRAPKARMTAKLTTWLLALDGLFIVLILV
jgi:hypothetical protein